ncbi:MAG: CDP-alcohol phosphatidyltransferase family protein [Propionibacteriaceae bacterium]|jgi:CDP-diacylglycerol--glycerol-3-phosphate 3-phosphatidyltransferase|nr:CDP-alcohol phosphatidyltransferase family protein [Propionibacteriaceae bacterium]
MTSRTPADGPVPGGPADRAATPGFHSAPAAAAADEGDRARVSAVGPAKTPRLSINGVSALTWPNAITAVRTGAAIVVGLIALLQASWVLLLAAYLTYWIGDILDGWTARRLDQETRLGAVFDILSDRACSTICVCALLVIRPEFAVALGVYYVQFMVVDAVLTLGFLHWPGLISPNYFYRVDRLIWLLNWSPVAKACNTGLLIVLLLGLPLIGGPLLIAVAVAVIQLALKVFSGYRMLRLTTRRVALKAD